MHPYITSHQNLKEKPTIQYINYPMNWKSAVKWKEGRNLNRNCLLMKFRKLYTSWNM